MKERRKKKKEKLKKKRINERKTANYEKKKPTRKKKHEERKKKQTGLKEHGGRVDGSEWKVMEGRHARGGTRGMKREDVGGGWNAWMSQSNFAEKGKADYR